MWTGSGAWSQPQWPMQQSLYQNIPHEEVDWAALAQQWIQMRETMTGNVDQPPPPPPPPPPLPLSEGNLTIPTLPQSSLHPPTLTDSEVGKSTPGNEQSVNLGGKLGHDNNEVLSHSDNSNSHDGSNSTYSQGGGDWGYWQTNWNASSSNWVPPVSSDSKEGIQSFEYGHMHGNQGYAAHTYDYNHGSDQFNCNQSVPDSTPYNQYWSQGGQPPFLRREKKEDQFDRDHSPIHEEESALPAIDAAKRKHLPAWIREGLEKMEREKQKKLDRERMLQERERRLRLQQEEEERAMREIEEKPIMPLKSKFDSDSDDDGSSSSLKGRKSPMILKESSPVRQRTPSPIDAPKTEQEKLEILMLKVRQTLTEILLEVTNEEIFMIAKETLSRFQAKAPALQLAKSSALSSIAGSLGGLGGYGTDSDVSEQEGNEDSDVELEENIRKKKVEFAKRERELGINCQSDMSDEEKDKSKMSKRDEQEERVDALAPKTQNTQVFLPLSSDSGKDKYHFEKEYAEIPGLGMINELESDKSMATNARLLSGKDDNGSKKESDTGNSDSSSSSSSSSNSSSSGSRQSRSDSSIKRGRRKRSSSRDRNRKGSQERRGRSPARSQNKHSHRKSRSRTRSRDRGRPRRSYSRDSSSRSRSYSKERSKGSRRHDSYHDRNRRRRFSRSRSRSYSSLRHSRSPSNRRRRTYGRSRSRSRSPKTRSRYSSRYSRSSSRDRYDTRLGKKSSRKPRV